MNKLQEVLRSPSCQNSFERWLLDEVCCVFEHAWFRPVQSEEICVGFWEPQ